MKVLEIQDAQGLTPLHCAAMFNHADLLSYLLEQVRVIIFLLAVMFS